MEVTEIHSLPLKSSSGGRVGSIVCKKVEYERCNVSFWLDMTSFILHTLFR